MKREGEPLDYIVLSNDFYELFTNLSTEENGILIKAIMSYFFKGEDAEIENKTLNAIYAYLKVQIAELTETHRMQGHRGGYLVKHDGRNIPGYTGFRREVLERDDYACQLCGSEEELHVHHIKPYAKFPELRTDPDNGITLCADCHKRIHHKMRMN